MSLTDDPKDPRLTRGVDSAPVAQAPAYLVLSEEERAKGFVRPVRDSYRHAGKPGPSFPLRDLTAEEAVYAGDFIAFEVYPDSMAPRTGRFWSQADLDAVGKGCGAVTTMARPLAETYAREPRFYGATYCVGCCMHKAVAEFRWVADGSVVGS
jgi:hypothetical protein